MSTLTLPSVFNRLTAVSLAPRGRLRRTLLNCVCACGSTVVVALWNLTSGSTKSCGCLRREHGQRNATHGMTKSPEYKAWLAMRHRCGNPENEHFDDYGGRGITVCPEWQASFEPFLSSMGPRPRGLSLERINTNGNYEPANCIWANRFAQA